MACHRLRATNLSQVTLKHNVNTPPESRALNRVSRSGCRPAHGTVSLIAVPPWCRGCGAETKPGNNHSSRIHYVVATSPLTKINTSAIRMIDGDPSSGEFTRTHTTSHAGDPQPKSSHVKEACTGRCLGLLPDPSDSLGTSNANAIARNNNMQTHRPPTSPLFVLLCLFSGLRDHGLAPKPLTLCSGRDQRAHVHADTFTCWFID